MANRMFLNLLPLQILVPCIAGSASSARRPQSRWRGEKNPSINLVPRAPQSLVLFPAPPPKPGKSALGTRLPINIFQTVTIRETRFANILQRSVLEKLDFFTSCPHEITAGGNSPNSMCCFVQFSHLVVKTLGMNVTIFLLFFYWKITPLCPSYQSKTMGTLSKSLRRPLLRSTTAVVDAESWGE